MDVPCFVTNAQLLFALDEHCEETLSNTSNATNMRVLEVWSAPVVQGTFGIAKAVQDDASAVVDSDGGTGNVNNFNRDQGSFMRTAWAIFETEAAKVCFWIRLLYTFYLLLISFYPLHGYSFCMDRRCITHTGTHIF